MENVHENDASHGATLQSDGYAAFRLWAPVHAQIGLALEADDTVHPMLAVRDGWHQLSVPGLRPGARYHFVLPDGSRVPDPASRFQPHGVHGPSELVSTHTYSWLHSSWRGRPWQEAVFYELHVGTFTEVGTFAAAIDRLDHLVELGITALQLMPVAAFPGTRNWGYDGVYPYACAAPYGHPDELKGLIDAAHGRGLMVFIDFVCNHFGPEGNYLARYAPQFFAQQHATPWGAAINFDGSGSSAVRRFFTDAAIRWLIEFRCDGLRLDAVHAIIDTSEHHFLDELAARAACATAGRYVHLVVEDMQNRAQRLTRDPVGRPATYTAQWNDDLHHVLHTAVVGESGGYYADYRGDTEKLGRALAEGFAFQGQYMPYRRALRGEPSGNLPAIAFIAFLQNHDQVGNRALGERIGALANSAALRAAACVYLLLPQIPLLFMGEEWNAAQPFGFFCDYSGELAHAVRIGRAFKCAKHAGYTGPIEAFPMPDPCDPHTFLDARLDWGALRDSHHAQWLTWYRNILLTRRYEIVPLLDDAAPRGGRYLVRGAGALSVCWTAAGGERLLLDANLSSSSVGGFPPLAGKRIWMEGERNATGTLSPWTVDWRIERPAPRSLPL